MASFGHIVTEQTKLKMRLAKIGKKLTKEHAGKISKAKMGHSVSTATREKIGLTKKGKPFSGKTFSWKGKKQSQEIISKRTEKNRGQKRSSDFRNRISGANCHLWRGGITPINKKIRESLEYKEWRTAVFVRDGFSCQVCERVGVRLEAHHIKSFSKYPELRFDVDNGVTLCKDCHKMTDNYGNKKILN